MAQKISKRLQARVLDILRIADTPLTTREVAMLVNRSYEATRQALALVGAERVDSSFPSEWKIPGSFTPATMQRVPSKYVDTDLVVAVEAYDKPVAVWNSAKDSLAKAISELTITPDDDPKQVALRVGNVVASMAYLAHRLEEVSTRPDWFDTLNKEG